MPGNEISADYDGRQRTKARVWPAATTAAALFLVTAAVNLQAPLYTTYAHRSGYGTGAATVAFACYVAGLVPVLVGLSGLSDRVGRKIPILAALLLAVAATVTVTIHPALETLAIARILLGMGVGLVAGAGTPFLAELLSPETDPQTAAAIVTGSTSLGFGSGALFTGLCLLFEQTLRPSSYFGYITLALLGVLALLPVRERRVPRKTPWIRLPYFPRGTKRYGCAIAGAWAVVGMVIAVVPVELTRVGMHAWAGPAMFLIICAGLPFQRIARRMSPRRSVAIGLGLVPLGYTLLCAGIWLGTIHLVLFGAVVASSACYGFTYLGGLAAVSGEAGDQRARASAGFFLFAYFGFSVPVTVSGFAIDKVGPYTAMTWFGIAIMIASVITGALMKKTQ